MFDKKKARSTARYQKARAAFLKADPTCKWCREKGIMRAATSYSEIKPSDDEQMFWDVSNREALCKECADEKQRGRNDSPARAKWREYLKGRSS